MVKPVDKRKKMEEIDDSDDDVPDAVPAADTQPEGAAAAAGTAAASVPQIGGKAPKKYAKAMAKMGLKPEGGSIVKVLIRKKQGVSIAVGRPEVYRFPSSNTFVLFGEASIDEGNDQQKAAQAVTGMGMPGMGLAAPASEGRKEGAAAAAAPADSSGGDDEVDTTGVNEKEIE